VYRFQAVAIATDITAFHVVGAALAIWAVVLAGLGIFNHDFPPKGLEKVVIAISGLLVVGAIGTAIGTSGEEKPKGEEQAGAKSRTGKEGSTPPGGGAGTPAPGTGSKQGQGSPGSNAQKPAGGAAAQTLKLSANPTGQLSFDKKTLSAKAGTVRIVMANPAPVPHNISLEGPGGLDKHGPTIGKGGDSQVQAPLKAGSYTFYCSVPGHRQAGMEGTLTVSK
jgi:plastocyanin